MPLETFYHVVCNTCRNYAGYNPYSSTVEALTNARRLGWDVVVTDSISYPGQPVVRATCADCLEAN
jgi:hypothetical protein